MRELGTGRAFWRRYFHATLAGFGKADYRARIRVGISWDRHATYTAADLRAWPGRILILEADGDPVVAAAERAALRALYPQAQVHTFRDGGHAASLARRDEYIAAIHGFLHPGGQGCPA